MEDAGATPIYYLYKLDRSSVNLLPQTQPPTQYTPSERKGHFEPKATRNKYPTAI